MAFQNLDMKKVSCFGWCYPRNTDWWRMANSTISQGWHSLDQKKFEASFAKNVAESYEHLLEADFEDLDDSIHYTCFFDNNKKLYELKLTNTDTGEILSEQKKEFFKSESFKKTAKRAAELVSRAKDVFEKTVKPHVEAGEMLLLDEVKLEAIESFINDQTAMRNLKLGKWAR